MDFIRTRFSVLVNNDTYESSAYGYVSNCHKLIKERMNMYLYAQNLFIGIIEPQYIFYVKCRMYIFIYLCDFVCMYIVVGEYETDDGSL